MKKKTVGIIGGMGPLATADLFKKIVLNTKAESDQEHLKVLVDNNTDISDRTSAILYGGKNPVPQLTKSALLLWAMGAEVLVMPCNTAHYFYNDVQNAVDIPVLHMIEITCNSLLKKGIKKAGLLATDGTIESGIYQGVFDKSGIELLKPDTYGQKEIMDMIYKGVKAGKKDYDTKKIREILDKLISDGAETLILGCTELPLAFDMYNLNYETCDPTLELAKAAVLTCGKECV